MSDEVRSRSIPATASSGELATEPAESAESQVGTPVSEAPPSRPSDSDRPTNPLPLTELAPRLLPQESPPPPSVRPPPPSQRARLASASTAPSARNASRSLTPLPISVSTSLPPPQRLSEPVPLVHRTAASMAPQPPAHLRSSPPQRSTLPPGLVEPKRIIEVLGSNVPVLDHQIEEEIEDLDDSEAHELAESQEQDGASSQSDFDLDVDFDAPQQEAEPGPVSEPGSLVDADQILDISSQPPTRAGATTDSGAARGKIPPKKRKRPTPPSTRSGEHKLDAAALEKAAQEKAEKAAQEKAAADRRSDAPPAPHGRKWWEEMFSEEFLRAIPILSPRQLEREVNCIEESLGVAPGGQILDLACGAGQHAVELAARGYDLVGFDLSQSQLDWASGLALERNQRLQFTNGDMRELSYQESFDAIYSWNTSFGFFEEDKNFDAAQRIFKALRPGGRFLLDVINRDFVVAQQPGQTWFEGDGCVCIDDVTIDFITSRMRVKRTLMLTNGKNRECTYSVRIYSLHELGKLLHDVGFKILKVSGRPEMPGVFFGSTSPRVIILAGKP
ncbi:MAG: hypothetical protein RL033_5413 [Pseudomonadota bacterium]